MLRRVLVFVLLSPAALLGGCSSKTSSQGCSKVADCSAGEVCIDQACHPLCVSNSDCGDGLVCGAEQYCITPSGAPPTVTDFDGTGTTDAASGHAAHHLAASLVVLGTNLTGASVDVVAADGGINLTGLSPTAASSDARLEVPLPSTLTEGRYLVRVVSAAGEAQAELLILQGEPGLDGTAITGIEIITKIDGARASGATLEADSVGSWTAARLDDLAAHTASPNLLLDTRRFRSIPDGMTAVGTNADFGPWRYFAYDAVSASITAEDPTTAGQQDLLDLIQDGVSPWWPQTLRVLHLKFSPGGAAPGRVLQLVQPSEKLGPVTMSAWVKVVAGGLYVGQEGAWQKFGNAAWQKVEVVNGAPRTTLGGAYGFAGDESQYTEAYVALPKLELSPVATPWLEAARQVTWSDSLSNAEPAVGTTSTTFVTITGSDKIVSIPAAGRVLVNWALAGYSNTGAGGWTIQMRVGAVATPAVECFTNEQGSHKSCSGTALVDVAAGTQTIDLQVKVYQGTYQMDGNDRIQWTAVLLPE